tara:strand:+ start:4459 stop:5829 length:1371 start_codon:yes stop_codon:yes gene_type:complete
MKIQKNISHLIISEKTKIFEAIKKISNNDIGALIVAKNKYFLGYLQEGDLKRALLINNVSPSSHIEKIMNKSPFVVDDEISDKEKIKKIKLKKRLRAPILNKNKIVKGIIYHSKNEWKLNIKKNNTKKILIIGGAGYIGSVLTRQLLGNNYSVIVYDSFKFGNKSLEEIKRNKKLKIINGSASDSKKLLEAAFGCDAIIDLSGIVGDPACSVNPSNTVVDNFLNAKIIIEIAKILKIKKYIYMSSCSVYGATTGKKALSENSKLNPVSLYAETKLKTENEILKSIGKNFNPTILRLGTVFGYSPRQRFDLVVNIFVLMAYLNKPINVFGGNQFRPNVHVKDVSEAIELVLKKKNKITSGQIFNVGSNKLNLKIKDIAKTISKLNNKCKILIDDKSEDKRNYYVNFNKINKKLGFKAKYTIEKGARELYKKIKEKRFKNLKKIIYNNYSIEVKNLYN